MKQRRISFAAAFLTFALLLTSCASGGGQNVPDEGAVHLTETANLMETLQQIEAAFQDDATLLDADSGTLRAEVAENGVHVSAHWGEAAHTVYFAAYAESGQMLGAAVAPDGVAAWETEILCDANQAATVKMFRLDAEARPVLPALVVSLAAGKPEKPVNEESDTPKVYFTSDISPMGLVKAYQALNWKPAGKTAVKLSTGEPPNSNYLRPELIQSLVQSVNGTIVECNTAYGGSRASAAMHKQVAADHGFTKIADFDLMDEDGETELPLTGGVRLNRAIVGSHIDNYDNFLILSHFKGHAMAGFGGAIKNVAIGMSSASGKVYVHTAGTKTSGSIWYNDQDAWLEALPEMVMAVKKHVGSENIVYVNVMNRLSVDCDCDGNPAEPDMHDIGILASYDPVALDQACVDLVYAAPDGASLIARMERQHGVHALEHGEEIGLGSRAYNLVNLDG